MYERRSEERNEKCLLMLYRLEAVWSDGPRSGHVGVWVGFCFLEGQSYFFFFFYVVSVNAACVVA